MVIPVEIQFTTKNATGNFLTELQHHHWLLGMCQNVPLWVLKRCGWRRTFWWCPGKPQSYRHKRSKCAWSTPKIWSLSIKCSTFWRLKAIRKVGKTQSYAVKYDYNRGVAMILYMRGTLAKLLCSGLRSILSGPPGQVKVKRCRSDTTKRKISMRARDSPTQDLFPER